MLSKPLLRNTKQRMLTWIYRTSMADSRSTSSSMTRFYPYPFFSDNCFVVRTVGRPLWREGKSVTYSAIADWSLRTNNHTLPSHLILCSLFVASYDWQGQRWRYFNPPAHGMDKEPNFYYLNNTISWSGCGRWQRNTSTFQASRWLRTLLGQTKRLRDFRNVVNTCEYSARSTRPRLPRHRLLNGSLQIANKLGNKKKTFPILPVTSSWSC
jgi:hypothetical protein